MEAKTDISYCSSPMKRNECDTCLRNKYNYTFNKEKNYWWVNPIVTDMCLIYLTEDTNEKAR